MKKVFFLFLLAANNLWLTAFSQSVGIGTATPHPSALLDLDSKDKGLLIPRMTIAKRDAIANPARGLMLYTVEDSSFYVYDGAWRRLVPADEVWNIRGNNGIDTSVHFIGTIDNKPVKFKVNNSLKMQLDGFGRLQLYSPGNNLFIGNKAGMNTSTGIQNHFTGYEAGTGNTSGNDNYFSGYQAGHANTTGSDNHFTGNFSGYSNTTGVNNQFIGLAAGNNNTTGNLNQFTGYWAGVNNTTGNNNYFSGFTAGLSNISGNGNTLVGNFTNVAGSNLTNAGAIGYNAIVSQSNSFVIGGTGPDAVNVGIGTTAPQSKLDIQGGGVSNNIAIFRGVGGLGQILVTQGTRETYLGTNAAGGYAGTNSGDFTIRTGAVDRMFFQQSTGRVGIGTNTPSEALHVAGNVAIAGNIAIDGVISNQAFQTPTFQGSWTNYSNGFANAGYYKDKEGRVHLQGTVINFTDLGTTIFILPTGYRPSASGILFFPSLITVHPGCVLINPNGIVELGCGATNLANLDGISFRAD
jgi:hypothetical protein